MKLRALVLALTVTALFPIHSVAAEVTSKSQQTAPGVFIDTSIYLPKKTPVQKILLLPKHKRFKNVVMLL
jgi:hypothetical protein